MKPLLFLLLIALAGCGESIEQKNNRKMADSAVVLINKFREMELIHKVDSSYWKGFNDGQDDLFNRAEIKFK